MDDGIIRAGGGIAVIGIGLCHDFAPWRDNQRMAIGAAAIRMRAALRGGNDEASGFNGTGTQQDMPVLSLIHI